MGQLFCPNTECAVLSFDTMFYPQEIDRQCPKCRTQAIEITIAHGIVVRVATTENEEQPRRTEVARGYP